MLKQVLFVCILYSAIAPAVSLPHKWCLGLTQEAKSAIRACMIKLELYPWDFHSDLTTTDFDDKCLTYCELEVQNMIRDDGDFSEQSLKDSIVAMAKMASKPEEPFGNLTLACVQKIRDEYASVEGGIQKHHCKAAAKLGSCIEQGHVEFCD